MDNHLDFEKIMATINRLEKRIFARFPDSDLHKVCHNFYILASHTREKIDWIIKPNILIRISVIIILILAVLMMGYSITLIEFKIKLKTISEIVQVTESAINDLVFMGIALFFLITIEARIKRNKALKALHELRSFAHIIDMHQLTKDPAMINQEKQVTAVSPERINNTFQLKRYLDYCSELYSLTGKLSALYSQSLPDPVVVSAANEIEILCTHLSRKVWQKIMILNNQ